MKGGDAQRQLEAQRELTERRMLLKRALTPEVLDALEETLGIRGTIFAFTEAEGYNALAACRRDTLTGVMKLLRHEVANAETSLALYNEMRKQHG